MLETIRTELEQGRQRPWNKGKIIGPKPPLQPRHVWSIRTWLQLAGRLRDLALFNLAIDSKLRGCDVVSLRVEDVAPHGCPRKTRWTVRYLRWLQEQAFAHPAQQIVLQEMVEAVRVATERVARLEKTIEEMVPSWSLAPLVQALQALRGIDLIIAVSVVAEIGDLRRFDSPRQLMAYLGLVPSERSTGDSVRRGPITKAGNGRVRHLLVESAWTYRHPPRVGARKLSILEKVPPSVREIAWKAQSRLTARYRALVRRGKKITVVCTAIARELVGFIWAIAREVRPA